MANKKAVFQLPYMRMYAALAKCIYVRRRSAAALHAAAAPMPTVRLSPCVAHAHVTKN